MSEKLRVLEAFAGIGSQTQALKNIGVPHEVVAISEIDKFAIKAYETIHGKVNNLGDVSKINPKDIPDFDLLTYSFPCTDISSAGRQLGFSKGSGTRSGLLWECEKIIAEKKPKYLLMENVKALLSGKFLDGFQEWVKLLDSYGYKTTYTVMNAKDYGVPQNRERVFAVSVLQDEFLDFEFPSPIPLDRKLKDLLENSVDEKYYLKNDKAMELLTRLVIVGKIKSPLETADMSLKNPDTREITNCITARYDSGIGKRAMEGVSVIETVNEEGIVNPLKGLTNQVWHFEQQVYSEDSLTRAVKAGGGSRNISKVIEEPFIVASRGRNIESPRSRKLKGKDDVFKQYLEGKLDGTSNTLTTFSKDNYVAEPSILRYPHGYNEGGEVFGYSPSITTSSWEANNLLKEPINKDNVTAQLLTNTGNDEFFAKGYNDSDISKTLLANNTSLSITNNYRIRKLTPKECWRLMGFPDEQFDKTQVLDEKGKPVISNAQLYKQAGNSIVVDVLENIFYTMFENTEYKPKNLPLRREKMDYIQGDRFENDSFELFSLIK